MNTIDEKQIILIVDDTPENIDIMSEVLLPEYKVKVALSGLRALKIAEEVPHPDMILLDVMMPDMNGYEVCKRLKANPATKGIPIIFITTESENENEQKGLELGAVDYIKKPFCASIVRARIQTHLALYDQNRALEEKVRIRTKELEETQLEIVHRLGGAAEFRDNDTGLHVVRMSHYSRLIAEGLGYGKAWSELIFNASAMHDLGKIGIPDSILLKPGKLSDEEWEIMRKHPEFGATILGDLDSELLKLSKEIALSHQEKWDGTGYPYGLKGKDIPLSGRLVAIADVFDALTTKRPYKKAWSIDETIDYIDNNAGTHFDPELVKIFHKVLPEIIKIYEKYGED